MEFLYKQYYYKIIWQYILLYCPLNKCLELSYISFPTANCIDSVYDVNLFQAIGNCSGCI